MDKTVYVVHCIDTEGPLHEPLAATFERLHALFGLELAPDPLTLQRLQAGTIDLGGQEEAVRQALHPRLLAYHDTWDKIDAMLTDCMSQDFRNRTRDSFGGGWIYNWFCVDHVGYDINPRRRDQGYHRIFDHYRDMIARTDSGRDGVHFHFHPHAFVKEAHRCATHWWANSHHLFEVLSRRVIDRLWFPSAHRPGFHVIRPDSHWFLEQFIPFDYASQAMAVRDEPAEQSNLSSGRFGDWRRAPVNWQPYHPDHDDYQVPGRCRRWVARCLNVGTRFALLQERDVRQAFHEAEAGKPVIMAFTNHDFRDLRADVQDVCRLLSRVAPEYPGVSFRFSEAGDAFRRALGLNREPPCDLDIRLNAVNEAVHVMELASRAPTFGPQPWLAIKTASGTYHHDNFEIVEPFRRWRYVLDAETFPLRALDHIGVAANNSCGITTITRLEAATGKLSKERWHAPNPHD